MKGMRLPQNALAPDDTVERGSDGSCSTYGKGQRQKRQLQRKKAKGTEREGREKEHHSYLILGLERGERSQEREKRVKCTGRGRSSES